MTRPRAFTSTVKYVIALLTALVVSVVGATALPAVALAGHGQAKGQQANRADNPGKAHQKGQTGKAHAAGTSKSAAKSNSSRAGGAQRPSQAQSVQDQRGQSAAAPRGHAKGSSGSSSGRPHAPKGGDKGDPPGNNGTVKIAPAGENDGTPDNNPHVGCTFQIEWYGFDEGSDIWSTVQFVSQAPTSDATISGTAPEKVFVGGDPATGAGTETGWDGTQVYTLSFDGEPHPQQGYHVKLTVHTPYSQGADTKHKVFWVEPCEGEAAPPGEDNEGEEDTDNGGEEDTDDNDNGTGGVEQEIDDDTETEVFGEQASSGNTNVQGAQASVQNSRGTQAAQQSANAEVPTAVEAGLTGDEWSRSVLPLLAVLFGFGTTFVALVRRRTRVEAITRD